MKSPTEALIRVYVAISTTWENSVISSNCASTGVFKNIFKKIADLEGEEIQAAIAFSTIPLQLELPIASKYNLGAMGGLG